MKRIIRFVGSVVTGFIVLSVALVFIFKWAPVKITPLMLIRNIEQNRNGEEIVRDHVWVSIEEISKNLQLAVICGEDQKFLKHNGFDVEAIEKAYKKNKTGKKLRGASTISQQTAKNVFLWPQRSWFRKGLETYFTFLIELIWSKERILEVYLNSVEMGNGIYGAESASKYWFSKSAKTITREEAAAIAAILPNPRKYVATPATKYIQHRKNWILTQMQYYGPFNLGSL